MRQALGETRSAVCSRHALVSEDSHERTMLSNWPGSELVFVITPQLGARFTEYFVDMPARAGASPPLAGTQRFLFVLSGRISLSVDGKTSELDQEGYAFVPADTVHSIAALADSRLIVLEKPYVELSGQAGPRPWIGHSGQRVASPLKGDSRLMVQKLLPSGPEYDCEVNIMEFSPGSSLPYVETHFMEHGLVFLNGGGIYRLDDCWYPVERGDVIWMGPFCPQWFGAIGRTNARYLIYKNWNRDPHVS